jgi:hypothetical protein
MCGRVLQDNWLAINGGKCVWGVPELDYLGHKISVAGVLPLVYHMATIQKLPRLTLIT